MAINPDSHIPIYEQIVEHVCGLIAAGVYREEEALPSVRGMAVEMRVNPNTIQRAYQELERSGFVRTRKGLGVFVASSGAAPAQQQTESVIFNRFVDGIDLGRRTKLGPARIETVFRRAMRSPRRSTRADDKRTEK
jgi:GntR family transcriptional regulator